MGDTLDRIKSLVAQGRVLVSDHAYDELTEDDILPTEIIDGLDGAIVIEDYPEAFKGPTVLTLHTDKSGRAVHAVWGIPKGRPVRPCLSRLIAPIQRIGLTILGAAAHEQTHHETHS